jgi:hypothetical protein
MAASHATGLRDQGLTWKLTLTSDDPGPPRYFTPQGALTVTLAADEADGGARTADLTATF